MVQHYNQCITEPCCSKNSCSAEGRPAPSVEFHSWSACHTVVRKECPTDGLTSISPQEWDWMIAEDTQLVRFVPSIGLGSACLNTAWLREKDGLEPYHTIPQNSATLPVVRRSVVVMIVLIQKKLRGFSPQASYTDRATAACRRNYCQLYRIEGVAWSAQRIPTAVNFGCLDRSRYFLSSSSIILTRLGGPRSRPTTSQKIW
jgi:hypothetical protein